MKVLSFSIKKFCVRFGLVSDYDIGGMINVNKYCNDFVVRSSDRLAI